MYALCWLLRVVVCLISSSQPVTRPPRLRIELSEKYGSSFQARAKCGASRHSTRRLSRLKRGCVSRFRSALISSFARSAPSRLPRLVSRCHPGPAKARPCVYRANGNRLCRTNRERARFVDDGRHPPCVETLTSRSSLTDISLQRASSASCFCKSDVLKRREGYAEMDQVVVLRAHADGTSPGASSLLARSTHHCTGRHPR